MFRELSNYIASLYDLAQEAETWWRRKTLYDNAFGAVDFYSKIHAADSFFVSDYWLLVWRSMFDELLDEVDESG